MKNEVYRGGRFTRGYPYRGLTCSLRIFPGISVTSPPLCSWRWPRSSWPPKEEKLICPPVAVSTVLGDSPALCKCMWTKKETRQKGNGQRVCLHSDSWVGVTAHIYMYVNTFIFFLSYFLIMYEFIKLLIYSNVFFVSLRSSQRTYMNEERVGQKTSEGSEVYISIHWKTNCSQWKQWYVLVSLKHFLQSAAKNNIPHEKTSGAVAFNMIA